MTSPSESRDEAMAARRNSSTSGSTSSRSRRVRSTPSMSATTPRPVNGVRSTSRSTIWTGASCRSEISENGVSICGMGVLTNVTACSPPGRSAPSLYRYSKTRGE
ncbi:MULTISPECIES: hypothetical protein [Streptomyces]|uniref:hypothetical protein n=1 Tax=Streptomyces TaxID=1883 RepID=UPI00163C9454|nr:MULTISPECIES: hypothetical protein [Streptomyces]MBC2878187.1 hypothetical protein [Streptomyces sp. TYQ1024]UBI39683.1 hypothetical protein K7I03_26590 [Streptomyces mobaraensis]UKW32263.1 hypothetical protein MCU78_26525 [Streptomyces sp. TYQ1024]